MTRFPVPERFLHDPEQAKIDARRIDALYHRILESVAAVMPDSLRRRTGAEAADAIVSELREAFEQLEQDPEASEEDLALVRLLAGLDTDESLARSLASDLPRDQEFQELIEEQSTQLAQVLLSAWIDLIAEAVENHSVVLMGDDLLPAQLSDEALSLWKEALHPFALEDRELARILSGIHERMTEEERVMLPHGLAVTRLELAGETVLAASNAEALAAGRPVIETIRQAISQGQGPAGEAVSESGSSDSTVSLLSELLSRR